MSVYSGFATRQLEGQYNKLITSLLKILQRRIIKFYKNEQADEQQFKRVVEETLMKLNQMEHQKYNEPYISAVMGEICDLLKIQQNCSTGCACQCHLQMRKQTFLTQDKDILSNPSSCRKQTVSSRKTSVKGINNTTFIEKAQLSKIQQYTQVSSTYKSPYYLSQNNQQYAKSKLNIYQNTSNITNTSSIERPSTKSYQRPQSKSPGRGISSRLMRSSEGQRANPNESLEEKRYEKTQTFGQQYNKFFKKRIF
ncbi:unnamed protein product [Paramecium primaurelia]|uniref:Uncharacterized protein n=1 Tax=Paramecium primaurelia TaxID=5886 RepID=A0A8S1ND46_PARPR|nr:unnamed protein product [Paramecium primaurelia]